MTHQEQELQHELRQLFNLCDSGGDGQVALGELILQCRKHKIIGAIFKASSKDEGGRNIEQLFREMDRDNSGTIGWDEFYRFFVREIHEEHEKREVQKSVCSIVLRLLRNHNLEKTAVCLEREVGVKLEAPSSSEEVAKESEAVKRFLHRAAQAQVRERERFVEIQQDFVDKQRRLGDMTAQMAQIRTQALEQSKKSDQNAQKQAVLQKLEHEHNRCLDVKRAIDAENDAVGAECDELLRMLATAEKTEEILIAELALLTREAAELRNHPMTMEERIEHLFLHWRERGGAMETSNQAFNDMDSGGDNRITWHNHELRNFVTDFLARVEVPMPHWGDFVWFEIYRNVDCYGEDALDRVEAANFCHHVLDAILHHVTDDPHSRAEHWARSYAGRSVPISQSPMGYNRTVIIDIRKVHLAEFQVYHQANVEHHERMIEVIERGEHAPRTLQEFVKCDPDRSGTLAWNNGEVRNFVHCAFVEHDLQPPPEQIVYSMHNAFLSKGKNTLDAFECVCMADALFRCSFFRADPGHNYSAASARSSPTSSTIRRAGTAGGTRTASTTATPVKRATTMRSAATAVTAAGRVGKTSAVASTTMRKSSVTSMTSSHTSVLDSSRHSVGSAGPDSPSASARSSPLMNRPGAVPAQVGKPTLRNVVKVVQTAHAIGGVREVTTGVRRSGTMHTSPPPKQLTRPATAARPVYGHG